MARSPQRDTVWFGLARPEENFSAVRSFPACRGRYYTTLQNTLGCQSNNTPMTDHFGPEEWIEILTVSPVKWSCNVICLIVFSHVPLFAEFGNSEETNLHQGDMIFIYQYTLQYIYIS